MNASNSASATQTNHRGFVIIFACLAGALGILFFKSFLPGQVLYSNDGPLGAISTQAGKLPGGFLGVWQDLNWIGAESIAAPPDFSLLVATLIGPVGYAKFFAAISLFILGLGAWFFFRQLRLAPIACILGGLAAALNSQFFSASAWGVVAQPVCFAANYFALAALANPSARHPWVRYILAGFAVGWGIMEGFDIGAIFSLFVAAYVVFQSCNAGDQPALLPKLGWGMLRVGVVAVCAAFIALQAINVLVGTQIKGVAGTAQDEETKKAHWFQATMWSVPPAETLQIIIPGIYGYRMNGWAMYNDDEPFFPSAYWGSMGDAPEVHEVRKGLASSNEHTRAQAEAMAKNVNAGSWHFSGGGFYAGVLVALVAIWGVAQSFRKKGSPFTLLQRRSIWFWLLMAIIALLLSFGRYAPFYHLFYALPYVSTIRIPGKFLHVFSWSLVILFAYGVHGLSRAYLQTAIPTVKGVKAQLKNWWRTAAAFDKKWTIGCLLAIGAGVLGWMIYASSRPDLEHFLEHVGFDDVTAPQVAAFSLQAVGWFILFLVLSVGLLTLILSGQFSGPRAKWAGVLLGLLLVIDLGRADRPWLVYWDYTYKYASNPIIDLLRDKPYEHRVALQPFTNVPNRAFTDFYGFYHYEWKQNLFPYYNIQNLEVVQEPRPPVDNVLFRQAIGAEFLREWELTNTRYVIGPKEAKPGVDFVTALNQQFDPVKQRFRILQSFDLAPKQGHELHSYQDLTAVTNGAGSLALIEFTGALPRAQLYANWSVNTNDDATLKELTSTNFDPHQTVLVADSVPAPAGASANQSAGAVRIKDNYQPKRIELEADAKTPSVLLLNDKYNPHWKVTVDGKSETMLRCNFIMRGVYLPPGQHTVVFSYEPPIKGLYVSLAAIALGFVLLGFVAFSKPGEEEASPAPAPAINSNPKKEKQKMPEKNRVGK
jgi:hypothetical protein